MTHLPCPGRTSQRPKHQSGLSLVELMIAMVLGLVVIGGVTSVVVSNSQSYRASEALAQLQENARTAFELMARDIRQAGSSSCRADVQPINILNNAQGSNIPWSVDWRAPLRGYGPSDTLSGISNRSTGTDALTVMSATATGIYVTDYSEGNNGARIGIGWTGANHGLAAGDILMICDLTQATIFQMTGPNSANSNHIVVNTGNSDNPGNCTKGLGPIIPGNNANQPCDTNGNPGNYGPNAAIDRLNSISWHVGNTGRSTDATRALYRNSQEVVAGITDLQLRYRRATDAQFVPASTIGNAWNAVVAVQITLTAASLETGVATTAGNNTGRLQRSFNHVVALRNRMP